MDAPCPEENVTEGSDEEGGIRNIEKARDFTPKTVR